LLDLKPFLASILENEAKFAGGHLEIRGGNNMIIYYIQKSILLYNII
jgi:hypothetical protein